MVPTSGQLWIVAVVVLAVGAGSMLCSATGSPADAGSSLAVVDGWNPGTGAHTGSAAAEPIHVASATAVHDAPTVPTWTWPTSAVRSDLRFDYRPSPQTQHIGFFAVLAAMTGLLGYWILVTRRTRGARLIAIALLAASLRAGSDVVHGLVGELWGLLSAMVATNVLLELGILLVFLRFAARYADEQRLMGRHAARATAAIALVATALVLTNPLHSLVFADFVHVQTPFVHVIAELGPLGWLLLLVQGGILLVGAGLLARSFTVTDRPAWWSAAMLALAICVALVIGGLSALGRGQVPQYDYAGAGLAGFVLLTTAALLGHGLRRIEVTARESIIEEIEDAIVILDDAHSVVDYNAVAGELLDGIDEGARFEELLATTPALPLPGEMTTTEMSRTDIVPPTASPDTALVPAGASSDDPTSGTTSSDSPASATSASDSSPSESSTPDGPSPDRSDDGGSADAHYLVQVTSVTTETHDSIGYTVRFVDVTTLKRRTMELAEKNEQLDQFASTVTHDLRNPLTVASGYVDLLEESVTTSASSDRGALGEYLGHVSSSLERMRVIIDDILALARGSDAVTDPQSVKFDAVVESAWESVDTRDARLVIESSGMIEADPDRLQRILENLFRNALDHVGTDVSLTTGLVDDGFYVADDGPGIPDAVGEEIFEHGYSGGDGTGLGLSIVRQLADAHGWAVRLVPDYEDGACFVFSGCTIAEVVPSDRTIG